MLVGFVGMVTTGRSLSKGMVSASCLAWRLPVRTKASVRVIGAIVGLIVGIGLVSTIINRVRAELGLAVAGISFLVAFAVYAVAWLLLSMLLPRATDRSRSALLPGAVLVGATLVGMQAISQLYLPDRFDRASQLYGAIGTTIVTLGWFFILGRAIVLAMAVNAVIYERFGSISQFVFSLAAAAGRCRGGSSGSGASSVSTRDRAGARRYAHDDEPPRRPDRRRVRAARRSRPSARRSRRS